MSNQKVQLPKRRVHETPRILLADAYTIGSNPFESEKCKDSSVYYLTLRRQLSTVNPELYQAGNDKMAFVDLQRILDKLFYTPITHEEIDEAKEFLKHAKATLSGPKEFFFPEEIWRDVVDNYNGRPPIHIMALPEGSVVYPNEPVVQIKSQVKGYGILAAWFESKLLQVWAASERVTQNEHWLDYLKWVVRQVEPDMSDDQVHFNATLMLHDFGDRGGITKEESEELGMAHLYTFPGTDTFSGAYQAFKNCDDKNAFAGCATSVAALAHRNVQGYALEGDCYRAIYDASGPGEFNSMVADCYNFKKAVRNYLLPLALESEREENDKIVVARPDSEDALEQVMWVCDLAVANGLFTERKINGKYWKFATTLHFIEGDGMTHAMMKKIIQALLDAGFAPYSWGLFGQGGGLRNELKRDNTSAKYALCAIGEENRGVVKYGMVGKTTLPGPFKVLRDSVSLLNKITIVHESEAGENAMVEFFSGIRIYKPFGIGQDDDFIIIKDRLRYQFDNMPLSLVKGNNKYPASRMLLDMRENLLNMYKNQ